MATYTTIATIAEVKKDNKILLIGVGKYAYEKEDNTKWIILEEEAQNSPKFLPENTKFVIGNQDEIQKIILAMAMINKKPLKLTLEESSSQKSKNKKHPNYTINSIKNP